MRILYLGEVVRNLLMTTSSEDSLNLFDWGQPHIYTIKWYTHDHIHISVLSRRHNYFYLLDVTSEQKKSPITFRLVIFMRSMVIIYTTETIFSKLL